MIKVVLFDLGNVLAKSIDNHKLYKFLDTNLTYEEFEEYWLGSKPVIDAHMGIINDIHQIKQIIDYCRSSITINDFLNFYLQLDNSLNENIIKIIKDLKLKYKVGILSNLRLMDYNRYKENIEKIGFDYLFLSYEMKCIKPNIDIYEKVIEKCQCKPNEILFFDDNIKNINGAKKCGINAYQVTGENFAQIENIIHKHFNM